jgi:hypothetical protein
MVEGDSSQAKIKSDKLDSRILADLLRGDLVYESYEPSKEFREKHGLSDAKSNPSTTPDRGDACDWDEDQMVHTSNVAPLH